MRGVDLEVGSAAHAFDGCGEGWDPKEEEVGGDTLYDNWRGEGG